MNTAGRKRALPKHEFDIIAKQIQALPEDDPQRIKLINKLIEHNLLLVVRFVSRFMQTKGAKRWGSEESLDYLQVGVLGLKRAIEKYDPTRGYCFSTYAQHWMRSFVGRYNYRELSIINIPESSSRAAFSYLKYGRSQGHGGFSEKNAKELTEQVFLAAKIDSLDRPIGEGITLADSISDRIASTNSYFNGEFSPDIEFKMDQAGLKPREKQILRYFYIDNMTFSQIAEIYDKRPDTVSRICCNARKKLKEVLVVGKM